MAEAETKKAAPVAKGIVGAVHWSVWQNGEFYSASYENRYKDAKSGEWKTATSYGPTESLQLSEAAREAAAEMRKRYGSKQAEAAAA